MKFKNILLTLLAVIFVLAISCTPADTGDANGDSGESDTPATEEAGGDDTPAAPETSADGADAMPVQAPDSPETTTTNPGGEGSPVVSGPDGFEGATEDGEAVESTDTGSGSGTSATHGSVPLSELPEGWIEDLPLMEGFTVDVFESHGDTMMSTAIGNVPIDDVTDYYMEIPGWESDADLPDRPWFIEGPQHGMTFSRDGVQLSILMEEQENGTLLRISVL